MHIRQSIVAATVTPRQSFVIDSHQVQNRGVKIMDMHGLFHSPDAMFVRGAMDMTAPHAGSGQP